MQPTGAVAEPGPGRRSRRSRSRRGRVDQHVLDRVGATHPHAEPTRRAVGIAEPGKRQLDADVELLEAEALVGAVLDRHAGRSHDPFVHQPAGRELEVVTGVRIVTTRGAPGMGAQRVAVTMRTPGHDFELAAGWLVHERVVRAADIVTVKYCTDERLSDLEEFNVVTVELSAPPLAMPTARLVGSACGVCGTDTVQDVLADAAPRHGDMQIAVDTLLRLPDRLRDGQPGFERTGGACTPPASPRPTAAWPSCARTSGATTPSTRSSAPGSSPVSPCRRCSCSAAGSASSCRRRSSPASA